MDLARRDIRKRNILPRELILLRVSAPLPAACWMNWTRQLSRLPTPPSRMTIWSLIPDRQIFH